MIKEKTSKRPISLFESNIIKSSRYSVRFARNQNEVNEALKLRFEVFNLELGEGLQKSFDLKMDIDKYDQQCDHLIVIENETGRIIGTYRMQTSEHAQKGEGFYTSEEFRLNELPQKVLSDAVELGRACIANGRVLFLMWKGLAEYIKEMNKRYLFGCCSVMSQDPYKGASVEKYLSENKYYHPDYFVQTTEEYICKISPDDKSRDLPAVELPPLFRLYLELGTLVCSPPAMDKNFKTIDFLILLDAENLNEKSKALFF
mgnify:CR=1 FL=1